METPEAIVKFESKYRKLPKGYRRKLLGILARDTASARASGLTLLALRAFPSSPLQKMLQELGG